MRRPAPGLPERAFALRAKREPLPARPSCDGEPKEEFFRKASAGDGFPGDPDTRTQVVYLRQLPAEWNSENGARLHA